jgi:hypothetical protein
MLFVPLGEGVNGSKLQVRRQHILSPVVGDPIWKVIELFDDVDHIDHDFQRGHRHQQVFHLDLVEEYVNVNSSFE